MRSIIVALATSLLLCVTALAACERAHRGPPPIPADPSPELAPATGAGKADGALTRVPVSGNLHMLMGKGGNIGVSVGADGILIVDDQFAETVAAIRAALGEISQQKVAFILNTHHHPDHVGGNPSFGTEGRIVASENVRKRLVAGGMAAAGLPVITFDQRLTLFFNGDEVQLLHLPGGHTDGDSVVFFPGAKVVHTGDIFTNQRLPYIDLAGGGNARRMLAVVDHLLGVLEPDVKIIPGHGKLATVEDLRVFRTMLSETIGQVDAGIQAGKTLAQLQKAGIAPRWKRWQHDFVPQEKWIEVVYQSLQKKEKVGE